MRGRSFGVAIVTLAGALLAFSSCAQDSPPKVTVPEPNFCKEPRPEMCMEVYQPVCGVAKDGTQKTFANSCHACADAHVIRYAPGACEADKKDSM